MKHRMLRLSILAAMLILLTALVAPVAAQEETPEPPEDVDDTVLFELIGELTFGEDGGIVVDGMNIAPAGAFIPADWAEGDMVVVSGYLLNDTTLYAISIEPYIEDDTDDTDDEEVVDDTGDDDEADTEGEDETEGEEGPRHPIGEALAESFGVDYDTIMAWHEAGYGFGDIARALLIAESQQEDMGDEGEEGDDGEGEDAEADAEELLTLAEELLGMASDGGWGQIMRDYDLNPSELAPGRVISNRPEWAGPPWERDEEDGNGPPGRPEGGPPGRPEGGPPGRPEGGPPGRPEGGPPGRPEGGPPGGPPGRP